MDKDLRTIVAGLRVAAAELEPGEERDSLVRLAKRLSTSQFSGGFGMEDGGLGTLPQGDPGGGEYGYPGPQGAAAPEDEDAVQPYSGSPGGITDPNRAPRQYWSMEFVNFPAMTYEEAIKIGAKIQSMIQEQSGLESVTFSGVPRALKTDRPNGGK